MRYFTPELIGRGASHDDQILDELEALWDELGEHYRASLDAVRAEMSSGLRSLVENYYLHDAKVRGMGRRGRTFLIVLQLDTPPHSLLTLTYDVIRDPLFIRHVLPPEYDSGTQVEWQYDEIEREAGSPALWSHSILFSNCWELQLNFGNVAVQEWQALPYAEESPVADQLWDG